MRLRREQQQRVEQRALLKSPASVVPCRPAPTAMFAPKGSADSSGMQAYAQLDE